MPSMLLNSAADWFWQRSKKQVSAVLCRMTLGSSAYLVQGNHGQFARRTAACSTTPRRGAASWLAPCRSAYLTASWQPVLCPIRMKPCSSRRRAVSWTLVQSGFVQWKARQHTLHREPCKQPGYVTRDPEVSTSNLRFLSLLQVLGQLMEVFCIIVQAPRAPALHHEEHWLAGSQPKSRKVTSKAPAMMSSKGAAPSSCRAHQLVSTCRDSKSLQMCECQSYQSSWSCCAAARASTYGAKRRPSPRPPTCMASAGSWARKFVPGSCKG